MLDDILTAIPLGFFLAFMIGPVFFVLLETSAIRGFRAALSFDLGVVLSDVFFISVAYFSSYRLIAAVKDDPALFIFGGIVMVTYGIISFIQAQRHARLSENPDLEQKVSLEIARTNYLKFFIKGFFLNFINIGVLGFWLAIIITFGPQLEMQPARVFGFFTVVMLSYLVTDIFKILLAKQLKRFMNPKNIGTVKKVIALILTISGIVLLSQGVFPKEKQLIDRAFDNIEQQN